MKQLLVAALVATGFAVVAGSTTAKQLCSGIVPPNDLHIPVNSLTAGGITEAEFNAVMDKMDGYYIPLLKAKGKTYDLKRLWTDDTVNASATEQGNDFIVNMYGGLARYNGMTPDGMMLVACHETGHHLGGAPKIGAGDGGDGGGGDPGNPWPFPFPFPKGVTDGGFPFPFPFPGGGGMQWASNEGAADYYGTLRCMHFIVGGEDNVAWVASHEVDAVAKNTCSQIYSNAQEAALCMRSATAGQVLAKVFQGLSKDKVEPRFDTPDTTIASSTDDQHPKTQCRMDTYYQGALCMNDLKQELSDTDYKVGTCIDYNKVGARPRCWFHPSAKVQAVPLAQAN